MKTVTDDFIVAQKKPDTQFVRVVEYKRRLWSKSAQAFTWEAAWTSLPENEVVKEIETQL